MSGHHPEATPDSEERQSLWTTGDPPSPEGAEQRALQQALRLLHRWLRYRPRTEAEVRAALERRGFSPRVVEAALAQARAWRWLDDQAFALLWVEQRARSRPRARWILEQELAQRGVPQEHIQQALAQVQDEDLLHQALEKALRRYRSSPAEQARRKVVAYLQRRGFTYEQIRRALEAREDLPWKITQEREP